MDQRVVLCVMAGTVVGCVTEHPLEPGMGCPVEDVQMLDPDEPSIVGPTPMELLDAFREEQFTGAFVPASDDLDPSMRLESILTWTVAAGDRPFEVSAANPNVEVPAACAVSAGPVLVVPFEVTMEGEPGIYAVSMGKFVLRTPTVTDAAFTVEPSDLPNTSSLYDVAAEACGDVERAVGSTLWFGGLGDITSPDFVVEDRDVACGKALLRWDPSTN